MFTVFGFLAKRQDLSLQEFIDYYENNHVPLILSLAPAPLVYKRRYLVRGQVPRSLQEPRLCHR